MLRGFVLLGLLAWLAGCTASPGTTLTPLSYESLEGSPITSLDYEISYVVSQTPNHPVSLGEFPRRLDLYLDKVFTKADPGIGRSPLHLVVALSAQERVAVGSMLRVLVFIGSAGLIPNQQYVDFTLNAERSWKGKHTRSYEYHEEMQVLQGWFFVPAGLSGRESPQAVANQVVDKMLAHFVSDLRADLEASR